MCNQCNTCNSCCNNLRRALNNLFNTESWNRCCCRCNNNCNGQNGCGCNASEDFTVFATNGDTDVYYARQYALFRNTGCNGCGCN